MLIPTSYTIMFEDGNDSPLIMQRVSEGNSMIEPKDPTCSGYCFDGWQQKGTSLPWAFNNPVPSDMTFEAKWSIDQ